MYFLLYGLAFLMLAMGLPAIFFPGRFNKALGSIMKNIDLMRVMSLWLMIIAFIFLVVYWKLDGTWNMLIAILGRLTLIKALVALWFPNYFYKKFQMFYSSKGWTIIIGLICLIMALFLIWAGMVKF